MGEEKHAEQTVQRRHYRLYGRRRLLLSQSYIARSGHSREESENSPRRMQQSLHIRYDEPSDVSVSLKKQTIACQLFVRLPEGDFEDAHVQKKSALQLQRGDVLHQEFQNQLYPLRERSYERVYIPRLQYGP